MRRPPSNDPTRYLSRMIHDTAAKVDGDNRQDLYVVRDPLKLSGDPLQGYATFVMGYLGNICGINAYGAAAYMNGFWQQVEGDTGWQNLTLTNGWTGTLQYRIIGNELRINGGIIGGTVGSACATLPSIAVPHGDGGYIACVQRNGASYAFAAIDVVGSGGTAGQIIPLAVTSAAWTLQINGVSLRIN
jgi:hypothetical protein